MRKRIGEERDLLAVGEEESRRGKRPTYSSCGRGKGPRSSLVEERDLLDIICEGGDLLAVCKEEEGGLFSVIVEKEAVCKEGTYKVNFNW